MAEGRRSPRRTRKGFIEETVFEWSLERGAGPQQLETARGCSRQSKCMQSPPDMVQGANCFNWMPQRLSEKKRIRGGKTEIDYSII